VVKHWSNIKKICYQAEVELVFSNNTLGIVLWSHWREINALSDHYDTQPPTLEKKSTTISGNKCPYDVIGVI